MTSTMQSPRPLGMLGRSPNVVVTASPVDDKKMMDVDHTSTGMAAWGAAGAIFFFIIVFVITWIILELLKPHWVLKRGKGKGHHQKRGSGSDSDDCSDDSSSYSSHSSVRGKKCAEVDHGKAAFWAFIIALVITIIAAMLGYAGWSSNKNC